MGDRQKQGIRRTPTPQSTPFKSRTGRLIGSLDSSRHDSSIRIIAFEYPIQGLEFVQRVRPQRMAPVSQNEGTKPFPKSSRLGGNRVELSRKAIGAYRGGCPGGHQLGLRKPGQQVLAVGHPFHHRLCRGTD